MSLVLFRFKSKGWTDDSGGKSNTFSWWRNAADSRTWFVCGVSPFTRTGMAVCDDFGNLVEVK